MTKTTVKLCFLLIWLITAITADAQPYAVTFSIDISTYTGDYNYTNVTLASSIDGWSGNIILSDPDGDDIWETTIDLTDGSYDYKFALDGYNGDLERFPNGGDCIDDAVKNRNVVVANEDMVIPTACWDTCEDCTPATCNITDIATSNISDCTEGAISSTFTADVTVTFSDAPATGMLDLTGDGSASIDVAMLGSATTYTFTGVRMTADAGMIDLTATFSDDAGCTFNNANAGTAPADCTCDNLTTSDFATGLSSPYYIWGDGNGNLFVAEFQGSKVTKIDAAGMKTDVATSISSPAGVWGDGNGNLFVTESENKVTKINAQGMKSEVATGLNFPTGVWGDENGNLFVAETGSRKVIKINAQGMKSEVATGLSSPANVWGDGNGNLFVAEFGSGKVIKIDLNNSNMKTDFATGFNNSTGVWGDGNGNLFVAEFGSNKVSKIDAQGMKSDFATGMINPRGVWGDGKGNLFVAENGDNKVSKIICDPCPTDLATSTAPAIQVKNSVCLTTRNSGSNIGGYFIAPTTTCPDGSTLEYSTDNSTTWSTDLPTYNQTTAMTVLTRCNCDGDTEMSSMTSTVTTVPGDCFEPCASDNSYNITYNNELYVMDFVVITSSSNETWTVSEIATGTIYTDDPPTAVTVGTELIEYTSGMYFIKFWTLAGSDYDITYSNVSFTVGLGKLTTCSPCSDLATSTAPAITFTESTCGTGETTPSGGAFTAITCPDGSTAEYSTNNGTDWSATLPIYNQTTAMTVLTRCKCDVDATVISIEDTATTEPGECIIPFLLELTGMTSAMEGTGTNTIFTFTIKRTMSTEQAATVDLLLRSYGVNAADDSDFTGNPFTQAQTVSFAADETSQEVSVEIIGDSQVEKSETFFAIIQNVSEGGSYTNSYLEVMIMDDDDAPVGIAGDDILASCDATVNIGNFDLQGDENAPTGNWTILVGAGGSFANPAEYQTSFSGTMGESYVLRFTNSEGSNDEVCISFAGDSDGDGVNDCEDRCPLFDDSIDSDWDGAPDACDCDPTTADDAMIVLPDGTMMSGVIPSDMYDSSGTLETNGAATVANGSNVTFKAAVSITLNAGFKVEAGALFNAYIAPCTYNPDYVTTSCLDCVDDEVTERELDETSILPTALQVMAYPNPAKDFMQIEYELPSNTTVSINLFNAMGKQVAMPLQQTERPAGNHLHGLNLSQLAPGIYYIRVQTKDEQGMQKIIVQR